jgi:hypothetical protein
MMNKEQQYHLTGKIAGGLLGIAGIAAKLTDNQICERAWRIAQSFLTQLHDDDLCWVAGGLARDLLRADPTVTDSTCIERCVRMTRAMVALGSGGSTYGQEQAARHGGAAG